MTTTEARPSTTVIDNPAYAWRNVANKVRDAFYASLDEDFVHDNIEALDAAATALFGPVLIQVWAEHGFQVTFGPDGLPMQRRPKGFPHHQVWDEAARHLDPHDVVLKAGLDDELLRYAAARSNPKHLEHHSKALRACVQPLRDELHARLDRRAEHATSLRAEQQVDGWRHLVDTAVTRVQLDRLDAQIPD